MFVVGWNRLRTWISILKIVYIYDHLVLFQHLCSRNTFLSLKPGFTSDYLFNDVNKNFSFWLFINDWHKNVKLYYSLWYCSSCTSWFGMNEWMNEILIINSGKVTKCFTIMRRNWSKSETEVSLRLVFKDVYEVQSESTPLEDHSKVWEQQPQKHRLLLLSVCFAEQVNPVQKTSMCYWRYKVSAAAWCKQEFDHVTPWKTSSRVLNWTLKGTVTFK